MNTRISLVWSLAAAAAVLFVVLLNGWMSDDAYITFRSVFHFTEGYGPVYNVGERVQTFTNPLWMFLMSGVYLFSGEAYYSALVLSLILCGVTLGLLQRRVFRGERVGLAVVALLVLSRSFVEYSTSGLENVLNGTLVMLFLAVWLNDRRDGKKLFWLALIAGWGMVSRMDTALLYAPAVFLYWWGMRSWMNLGRVLLGLSPFILWEAFAVIYYGFPFPNTAYAKLNTGLAAAQLWRQGLHYFQHSLERDPITLAIILGGLVATGFLPRRRFGPIALGVGLYLVYLVRVGGDFMGGRFFYLPVLLSGVLLGFGFREMKALRWGGAVMLLLGLLNFHGPLYNWARGDIPRAEKKDRYGIADERAWYRPASAWITLNDSSWVHELEVKLDTTGDDPPNEKLLIWDFIGFVGYGVGPSRHVVDRLALADPLLARLPMAEGLPWRVGHYPRVLPRGFRRSIVQQKNLLEDPQLHRYYDELRRITQGPIWSGKRWQAIIDFNLGKRDHWIDQEFYRRPSRMQARLSELQNPLSAGSPFLAPGQIAIYDERPLTIDLEGQAPFSAFEISLFGPNKYRLTFKLGQERVARMIVHPRPGVGEELAVYRVETPPEAREKGFDALVIESQEQTDHYAIGHLIPVRDSLGR
ncbi:MAG: hypothetical protein AAF998_07405 [Bacteroidota bacterium]